MKAKSVAIVTGASQGIGRATALRLTRDFSAVVLVARDKDNLEKTAAAARGTGAEPLVFALDLGSRNRRSSSLREPSKSLAKSTHCSTSLGPCLRSIYSK